MKVSVSYYTGEKEGEEDKEHERNDKRWEEREGKVLRGGEEEQCYLLFLMYYLYLLIIMVCRQFEDWFTFLTIQIIHPFSNEVKRKVWNMLLLF